MRRGATLPELSLTLILVGILLLLALPRIHGLADSLAVGRAAHEIAAAHRRARMAAVLQSRLLELTVEANALTIRPSGGGAHRLARATGLPPMASSSRGPRAR